MAYSFDTSTKYDVTSTTEVAEHNIRETANSTYSSSTGTQTNVFLSLVRTYIAGVLTPTLAISISCAFDANPTARITIPADPRLYNLGKYDRVPVQVFVKETVVEAPKYILMFEGFIASRTYMSVANQREINLECVAFTQVFDDTKFRFMTSIEDTFAASVPGVAAGAEHVFTPGFMFPLCLFYQGIGLKPEDGSDTPKVITRPTDYLVNLIQYMEEAGTDIAPAGRFNDSLVSKYFATLAYNLRLDRRFCWLPYFDTEVDEAAEAAKKKTSSTSSSTDSKKWAWEYENIEIDDPISGGDTATMFPVLYGLKTDAAISALGAAMQTASKEFTIFDLLKYLVNELEYEFLVIANPAFHDKSKEKDEGLEIDSNRKAVLDDATIAAYLRDDDTVGLTQDATEEMVDNLRKKYAHDRNCQRMVNFCLKPMFDDTYPPLCNVIFRSQVTSIQAHEIFSGTPTRIQVTNFNSFFGQLAAQGASSDTLRQFGSVDFYPSKHYGKTEDALNEDDDYGETESSTTPYTRALLSGELLDVERHTGPWIHRDSAPNWLTYAFTFTAASADITDDPDQSRDYNSEDEYGSQLSIKRMRELYMRRQLMRAQILSKQLTATCAFLPYITCGFPALIYDSADSGFSFAGNVISYEHTITDSNITTTVILNGVRLLDEAVTAEANGLYPNAINSVHAVTHNEERLARVYSMILGTPDVEVSGATPITWADAKSKYSGSISSVTASPQTNIYEAYKLQRRNVITFDDYCTFMGLSKNATGDDESGSTPTEITNDWINDRAKVAVFGAVPLLQTIKPVSEDVLRGKEKAKLESQKTQLEEANKQIDTQIAELQSKITSEEAELQAAVTAAQAKVDAEGGNTSENQAALTAAQVALSDFQNNTKPSMEAQITSLNETKTSNTKEIAELETAISKYEGTSTSNKSSTSDSAEISVSGGTSTTSTSTSTSSTSSSTSTSSTTSTSTSSSTSSTSTSTSSTSSSTSSTSTSTSSSTSTTSTSSDVRTLLKTIYTQETANNVY